MCCCCCFFKIILRHVQVWRRLCKCQQVLLNLHSLKILYLPLRWSRGCAVQLNKWSPGFRDPTTYIECCFADLKLKRGIYLKTGHCYCWIFFSRWRIIFKFYEVIFVVCGLQVVALQFNDMVLKMSTSGESIFFVCTPQGLSCKGRNSLFVEWIIYIDFVVRN